MNMREFASGAIIAANLAGMGTNMAQLCEPYVTDVPALSEEVQDELNLGDMYSLSQDEKDQKNENQKEANNAVQAEDSIGITQEPDSENSVTMKELADAENLPSTNNNHYEELFQDYYQGHGNPTDLEYEANATF